MININKFDVSGTITRIKQEDGFYYLMLSQTVGGVMPTDFTVLVKGQNTHNIGEEVLLESALVYAKGDKLRLKVAEEQIKIIKTVADLGTVDAEDKFI